ncbi:hypothetical protein ACP4OV_021453 [Aristida adscensionis]
MSGGGGGDPAAAGLAFFDPDDVDSFFMFQRSPPGEGGGGGGDGGIPPYSGITAYLQGFLDAAPSRDGSVKQEMVSGHDDGRDDAGRGGAPLPATPNSSSVLSSSSPAAGERQCKNGRPDEEGEEASAADRNCKTNCKEKKKKKKGEKKPRVAFMTKSEVDHLEDGYRWRKYGQKAVKNSSYPRSYYRCTAARCWVKKRVERSQQDPSTVITTYEGQHTHVSPTALVRRPAAIGYELGGFRPDLAGRLIVDCYGHGGARVPISSTAGMPPPPIRHLLQEHRAAQLATYGGVLDFVPSAIGNGTENDLF